MSPAEIEPGPPEPGLEEMFEGIKISDLEEVDEKAEVEVEINHDFAEPAWLLDKLQRLRTGPDTGVKCCDVCSYFVYEEEGFPGCEFLDDGVCQHCRAEKAGWEVEHNPSTEGSLACHSCTLIVPANTTWTLPCPFCRYLRVHYPGDTMPL